MAELLGDRLAATMKQKGLKNPDVATALGVHPGTVSKWRSDTHPPEGDMLDRLAKYLGVSAAWLRYGGPRTPLTVVAEAPAGYASRPKLPPRAYERVYGYMERLRKAGVPEDDLEEAERLLTEPLYSKINKREIRERSEDDLITDIDAMWSVLKIVAQRNHGAKL